MRVDHSIAMIWQVAGTFYKVVLETLLALEALAQGITVEKSRISHPDAGLRLFDIRIIPEVEVV